MPEYSGHWNLRTLVSLHGVFLVHLLLLFLLLLLILLLLLGTLDTERRGCSLCWSIPDTGL